MPQVLRELGDEIVGLPVLAVVKEVARDASTRTHLVEFAEHYFTAGPVYYDSTLSIYRALGHREGQHYRGHRPAERRCGATANSSTGQGHAW